MLLADVAVPVPLARAFTYEVPPALQHGVGPGSRVVCEFGRRKVLGVVLAVSDRDPPAHPVKPIVALLDSTPVVPRELLAFLTELSAYYFAPIGEVLRLALPAVERERVRALEKDQTVLGLAAKKLVGGRLVTFATPTDVVEDPGKLRGQAAAVLATLRAGGELPVARLEERFKNARAGVKRLESLGLVRLSQRETEADPFFSDAVARDAPLALNDAQASAAERIAAAIANPEETKRAFLLFGVTGSGKTEVYLRAIASALAARRGALVLVPEIALTPQLVARFRARFGDALAVLHSALSETERHGMWSRLRRGEVAVAVGARSALFAPVPDLGLIIVDEEHDSSFKQEEGVRYHARDMAILRAHRAKAAIVLGSATPSLESIGLVRTEKLEELRLPERAVPDARLPTVTVVDLRRIGAGPTGNKLLSLPLHRALEETLDANEQALVFLNRRGFAPSVVCDACGTIATCRSCSVALTYHRGRGGRLACHYCDFDGPLPPVCEECGAPELALEGLGTERLEATIADAFPTARVARLDRDVGSRGRGEAILEKMRSGAIDILVGTQMITKGHDLPNVTLVGVVNADASLSHPDFRASERGFQLLVQVAGRAGRRGLPGRVIIQSRAPEHPAVRFAVEHDVRGFLERELRDRMEVGYPPFARLALLRVDAVEEDVARAAAGALATVCKQTSEVRAKKVDVLGPAPAPLARLRNRYRFRVLLRARERGPLRLVLARVVEASAELDRHVRWVIDVDPVSML